jgi:hypothetical protein
MAIDEMRFKTNSEIESVKMTKQASPGARLFF